MQNFSSCQQAYQQTFDTADSRLLSTKKIYLKIYLGGPRGVSWYSLGTGQEVLKGATMVKHETFSPTSDEVSSPQLM